MLGTTATMMVVGDNAVVHTIPGVLQVGFGEDVGRYFACRGSNAMLAGVAGASESDVGGEAVLRRRYLERAAYLLRILAPGLVVLTEHVAIVGVFTSLLHLGAVLDEAVDVGLVLLLDALAATGDVADRFAKLVHFDKARTGLVVRVLDDGVGVGRQGSGFVADRTWLGTGFDEIRSCGDDGWSRRVLSRRRTFSSAAVIVGGRQRRKLSLACASVAGLGGG